MVQRRTNRGQVIDFDKLVKSTDSERPAIGNMGTDGQGNKLGAGGRVVQSKEDRVRAYYADLEERAVPQKSLKGAMPDSGVDATAPAPEVKTAKTAQENVRTAPDAPLGEDFDENIEQEPLGYKEVELPNGDIEMVPYYKEEDAGDVKKD
jgi:hypothetical protein